jgi:hypothetical protein
MVRFIQSPANDPGASCSKTKLKENDIRFHFDSSPIVALESVSLPQRHRGTEKARRIPRCLCVSVVRMFYRKTAMPHTTPLRNSSSGYFVPRQVTPSSRKVRTMERISVYSNIIVLMGCSKK